MAQVIKIKRSTGTTAPTGLAYGELAYVSGTGKLYFGSSTNGTDVNIFEIGGKAYVDLLSNITPGTVAASKAVIVDANKSVSGFNTVGFSGSTSGTATLSAQAVAGTGEFVLPSTSGTLVGSGDTGTVTNAMLAGSIENAKLVNSSVTVNGSTVSLGSSITLSTTDIGEGTNLYYTDARARGAVSLTTSDESVLSYNSSTGVFTFTASALKPTITVENSGTGYGSISYTQASGTLTYTKVTDADIRGAISANDAGGDGSFSYDSATGVFTYTGPSAADIRTHFSAVDAGGDGSFSYDSATGAFTYTGPSATEVRAHFTGGTGVTITDGSIAIGQAVGTTDNVTFNNVTVSGTLSSDDITAASISIDGNAVIVGNLTVQGTTTTVNSTAVAISDVNLTLAKDATTAAQADGAGLTVAGASATLTYASTGDKWVFNKQVEANVTGDLTGNADSATALETARDFSVSGDVATASAVSFDGTANVTLAVTLTDSAVVTSKIANDAVTSAKMAAGSVELATDTVTGVLPVANGGTGASTLDSGKLLIGAGTSAVTTDSGLAWNGATDTLSIAGAAISTDGATGTVTISSTGTNADIILAPNGTGSVTLTTNSIIFDSTGDGVVESAVGDSMTIRGDTGLMLEATSGDIEMTLAASDANKVTIVGPTAAQYATGIEDNDLVTKYWVQTEALDGGTY